MPTSGGETLIEVAGAAGAARRRPRHARRQATCGTGRWPSPAGASPTSAPRPSSRSAPSPTRCSTACGTTPSGRATSQAAPQHHQGARQQPRFRRGLGRLRGGGRRGARRHRRAHPGRGRRWSTSTRDVVELRPEPPLPEPTPRSRQRFVAGRGASSRDKLDEAGHDASSSSPSIPSATTARPRSART